MERPPSWLYWAAPEIAWWMNLEYMKEQAYKRLQHGEEINLSELGRNGNDLVQVVWELNKEITTGQYTLPDFDNKPEELVLKRVNPLAPEIDCETAHLKRQQERSAAKLYLSRIRSELKTYE